MGAWVDRMAVAIEAGIITREEATRAYERGRRDVAA
jgi:predicted RNA-binding protein associated with RNAse of E/G family